MTDKPEPVTVAVVLPADTFREQLDRVRAARGDLESRGKPGAPRAPTNRGVDRSQELKPVSRPALVRAMAHGSRG